MTEEVANYVVALLVLSEDEEGLEAAREQIWSRIRDSLMVYYMNGYLDAETLAEKKEQGQNYLDQAEPWARFYLRAANIDYPSCTYLLSTNATDPDTD